MRDIRATAKQNLGKLRAEIVEIETRLEYNILD